MLAWPRDKGRAFLQRQKDEDFVFEDEDSTCRDKLIELYQKALNSFPDGKRTDDR